MHIIVYMNGLRNVYCLLEMCWPRNSCTKFSKIGHVSKEEFYLTNPKNWLFTFSFDLKACIYFLTNQLYKLWRIICSQRENICSINPVAQSTFQLMYSFIWSENITFCQTHFNYVESWIFSSFVVCFLLPLKFFFHVATFLLRFFVYAQK